MYMRDIKFGLCSWLLTSVVLCLLSFLSSHSSRFLAKRKETERGRGALFFSSDDRAAAAAHRKSGVVTHGCHSGNRWSVKEKALQSHTGF